MGKPPIVHERRLLALGITGDLMVLDMGEVEPGDLVFLSGHLIRRVLTAPRDQRVGDDYSYEVEGLDTSTRGTFRAAIGSAYLVLRPSNWPLPEEGPR